nr:MAG: ORF1 protein [Riboviria sp.]
MLTLKNVHSSLTDNAMDLNHNSGDTASGILRSLSIDKIPKNLIVASDNRTGPAMDKIVISGDVDLATVENNVSGGTTNYLKNVLTDIGLGGSSGYESDGSSNDIVIHKPKSTDMLRKSMPKFEQQNEILESDPCSGITYTGAAIDQFFNAGTVSKDILMSLLNSDSSNVLRQTITNEVNNNLKKTICSRRSTGVVVISEILTPEETAHIQLTYSDLDITFTNSTRVSHAFASASRKCERVILIKKLNVDLVNDKSNVLVKDIGGNIIKSTMANEKNIHCCSPVLSAYDGTRLANRLYDAISFHATGIYVDNMQHDIIKSFIENVSNLKPHNNFCFSKGEDCHVKANGLLFLHSNYDISLQNFAKIMESSGALVAYGSFIFDPRILTDDFGVIPWLNARFTILRDNLGRRKTIRFGFDDCNGFNYEHDYDIYISYVCHSQFVSKDGKSFSLELLENRDGVQFFRVSKLFITIGRAVTHKVHLTHLRNKYIVRFPYCSYSNHKFFNPTDTCRSLFDESFWSGLPTTTDWIYVPIDKEVIDKTAAFVLGATCEKFKPENITNYLRSVLSREIMYSSVINKRDLPNHYILSAVTHALYVVLYQTKYVFGKVMQQALTNVNATRDKRIPNTYLKEFFLPEKACCLIRFIRWLFGTTPQNYVFDARLLIIEPPEYFEYVSPVVDPFLKIDSNFLPNIHDSDVLIASQLSAAYNNAFAKLDPAIEVQEEIVDRKPVLSIKASKPSRTSKFDVVKDKNKIKNKKKKNKDLNLNEFNEDTSDDFEMVDIENTTFLDPLRCVDEIVDRPVAHIRSVVGNVVLSSDSGIEELSVKLNYESLEGVEMATEVMDYFDDDCDLFNLENFSLPKKIIQFDDTPDDELFVPKSIDSKLVVAEILEVFVGEFLQSLTEIDEVKLNFDTNTEIVEIFTDNPGVTASVVPDMKILNYQFQASKSPIPNTVVSEGFADITIPNFEDLYDRITDHPKIDTVKQFINTKIPYGKSRGEAKMDEILCSIDVKVRNFLDLCAAPGGFTRSILNKYPNATPYFHYYKSQHTLPLFELPENTVFIEGNLLQSGTVKSCVDSGPFDLVVADGCCDDGWNDSNNYLLFASETKVAISSLVTGGTFIIKLFCDKRYLFLLESFAKNFSAVELRRLVNSNKLSNEFYVVCTGFGGHTVVDNSSLNNQIRSDLSNFISQLNYPRLGILKGKLVDVDGSRNECCFLAACEDRQIDVCSLRNKLLKEKPDPDLIEELTPGKYAGLSFLFAFSKHYNVAFSVDFVTDNQNLNQVVDATNGGFFRKINLKLSDYHYYYKNDCTKQDTATHTRYLMFEPFDFKTVVATLRKNISFKSVASTRNITESGVYLINNLNKFCTLHNSCRNNFQQDYFDFVHNKNSEKLNISIIIFFERNNFDMDFAEGCSLRYPDVSFKPIKLDNTGYFAALVYTVNQARPIKSVLSVLDTHQCGQNNYDKNLICKCKTKSNGIVYSTYSNVNLNISIGEQLESHKGRGTLTYKRSSSDFASICYDLANFFGWSNPPFYHEIGLTIDTPKAGCIINILKNRCDILYVNVKSKLSYLPDHDNQSKIKNMMNEVLSLWNSEKSHAINTLACGYNLHVDKNGKFNDFSTSDTSFVLLDLKNKTFNVGFNLNLPYNWGYSNGKLLNTKQLFRNKTLNFDVADEFLKKGHTYIAFNSTSRLLNGVELSNKFTASEIHGLHDFDIVFYQGVPGAGKTQLILSNNKGKRENLILTVTREAKEDMRKRASEMNLILSKDRIRTVDSYLLHGGAVDVDELWIDEALLVHAGSLMWAAYVSGCRKLVLVGDRAQIPYINRTGETVVYSNVNILDLQMEYLKTDYRNPLDIVRWLHNSGSYNFDVTGVSKKIKSVDYRIISGSAELKPEKNVKYLTYTQAEKVQLGSGFNVSSIHEYQGNQTDDIVLVRLNHKKADIIYDSIPHKLVALTRHRNSFRYLTVVNDKMTETIDEIKNYTVCDIKKIRLGTGGASSEHHETRMNEYFNMSCRKEEFYAVPDMSTTLYLENKELVDILISNGESGYVSWDFGVNKTFNDTPEPPKFDYCGLDYSVLQDFNDRILARSSVMCDNYDHHNFEYYSHTFDNPGVMSHLVLPCFKRYDYLNPKIRTAIQYPIHDSTKTHLKAFNERNGQVPQLQGTIDAIKEAKLLLEKFKLLFVKKPKFIDKPILPDIRKLESWLNKQPPRVRSMILSEDDFHDQNFSAHDFILKNLAKIDLEVGCENRYKSPQTIIHQPKTINSVFCPIMRQLLQRVEYCLNPDIIMYNNMSPQEFCQHLKKIFPPSRYKKLNRFLEIDFSKYDKSQGLVLLIFEALLMEFFGVSPIHIKIWIIMHRLSVVHSRLGGFSTFVEYQRKSGDAATWTLNTIIQIAVLNRVFRLYIFVKNGKIVCMFSGDDSLIFYFEDIEDLYDKLCKLQYLYNLEAKLMNYNIPYFCSKFLLIVDDEWIFVPDTLKLIIKLGRKDLVDFEHAQCYKISFDDNLYYYKFIQNWPYISRAINDRYKINGEHDIIFQCLLDVVSSENVFASLYFKPIDYVSRKFTIRPNLEI